MASRLVALCYGSADPGLVGRFWSALLDWTLTEEPGGATAVVPADVTAIPLRFRPTTKPRHGLLPIHLHLTSAAPEDQQRTATRALELGGRHLDVGQRPDEGHIVLADPQGNEFCVIEAGNRFLAGCGLVGELAGDGLPAVGYFWSAALGWPLVWDQDGETAVQSARGGPKISWGGPPVRPRTGPARVHLELAPAAGSDQPGEVDRLVSLGATLVDLHPGDGGSVVLADPAGNEFWVHPPAAP